MQWQCSSPYYVVDHVAELRTREGPGELSTGSLKCCLYCFNTHQLLVVITGVWFIATSSDLLRESVDSVYKRPITAEDIERLIYDLGRTGCSRAA